MILREQNFSPCIDVMCCICWASLGSGAVSLPVQISSCRLSRATLDSILQNPQSMISLPWKQGVLHLWSDSAAASCQRPLIESEIPLDSANYRPEELASVTGLSTAGTKTFLRHAVSNVVRRVQLPNVPGHQKLARSLLRQLYIVELLLLQAGHVSGRFLENSTRFCLSRYKNTVYKLQDN